MMAGIRAALRAELDDAVVFAGGGDGQLAFARIVAGGFFDIDVLAGGAAEDRGGGVPVIGRGAEQDVDVFVVEGLAEIGDARGLSLLAFRRRR